MHWPSPDQRHRIAEIRDNLTARIAEAEREGWLGEIEGLKISLAGASDKLAQIDRRARSQHVDLGVPAIPASPQPATPSVHSPFYPLSHRMSEFREAGVDRAFFYRHRDLLAQLHALEATPPAAGAGNGPGVSRASLQTDLLAAGERAARLHSRVRQLEKRLSETLGEQAWRESGLGTPADIDALNQKIIHLEQQAIDLRLQLEEQGDELAAARATNRELMTQLNHASRPR